MKNKVNGFSFFLQEVHNNACSLPELAIRGSKSGANFVKQLAPANGLLCEKSKAILTLFSVLEKLVAATAKNQVRL